MQIEIKGFIQRLMSQEAPEDQVTLPCIKAELEV